MPDDRLEKDVKDLKIGLLECHTGHYLHGNSPLLSIEEALAASDALGGLDILVAPELFFAPESGVCTVNEYESAKSSLEELSAKSGTLILPGTFPVSDSVHYRNVLPIIYGGKTLMEYSKRYDWGDSQFAKKNGLLWLPGEESGIFRWKNRSCAVEICQDHEDGALSLVDGLSGVDMHFIVSCGVRVQKDKVVARHNGLVVYCDGFGHEYDDGRGLYSYRPSLFFNREDFLERIQHTSESRLSRKVRLKTYSLRGDL